MFTHWNRKFEISRFAFMGGEAQAEAPEHPKEAQAAGPETPGGTEVHDGKKATEAALRAREAAEAESRNQALAAYLDILLSGIQDQEIRRDLKTKLHQLGEGIPQSLTEWQEKHSAELSAQNIEAPSADSIINMAHQYGAKVFQGKIPKEQFQTAVEASVNDLINKNSLPKLPEAAKIDFVQIFVAYLEGAQTHIDAAMHEIRLSEINLTPEEKVRLKEFQEAIKIEEGKMDFDQKELEKLLGTKPEAERKAILSQLEAIRERYGKMTPEQNESALGTKISAGIASFTVLINQLVEWLSQLFKEITKGLGISEKGPEIAKQSPVEGNLKIIKADEKFVIAKTEAGKDLKAPADGRVANTGEDKERGGNYIVFELADGRKITFFGLKTKSADVGKPFTAGQTLGQTKDSLRIEIAAKDGSSQNPLAYFEGNYENVGVAPTAAPAIQPVVAKAASSSSSPAPVKKS